VNATGVTAGPAESNGKLLLGIWRDSLHVTCGLTACTPGSALSPTLGNEYGKTLPFLPLLYALSIVSLYLYCLYARPTNLIIIPPSAGASLRVRVNVRIMVSMSVTIDR